MEEFGIYIHIPYCKRKCTYCNFHYSTQFSTKVQLLKTLGIEIENRCNEIPSGRVRTIYFGGGTPSALTIDEIHHLMILIQGFYTIADDVEVTFEANPEDLSLEYLQALLKIGINRLSIGIQSFRDNDLLWMNRNHSSEMSHLAIQSAIYAGFRNISCDLIFGIPDSSDEQWLKGLQFLGDYGIPHLSCYALTVEEKTKLYHDVHYKKTLVVDDEQVIRQMNLLFGWIKENDYEAYEISNYCKPGFRSIHNANYWLGKPYLGFGPSAHSYYNQTRRWNISNNALYIKSIENDLTYFDKEELTLQNRYNEYIMINLRRMEGIDIHYLENEYPEFWNSVKSSVYNKLDQGFLQEQEHRFRLTNEGKIISDSIIRDLFVV